MSTQKETIEFILEKLGHSDRFSTRAMFGEYALYVDGKVVGFVCGNQLYIKILSESKILEAICEKDQAYPGSKLYYLVEESQISHIIELPEILFDMSKSIK